MPLTRNPEFLLGSDRHLLRQTARVPRCIAATLLVQRLGGRGHFVQISPGGTAGGVICWRFHRGARRRDRQCVLPSAQSWVSSMRKLH
jgi:hypothetical protein